jgi:two-component system, response regulator
MESVLTCSILTVYLNPSNDCMAAKNMKAAVWGLQSAGGSLKGIVERSPHTAPLEKGQHLLLPYPCINPMEKTLMDKNLKPVIFLMADDDPDDRLLIKEAFQESLVSNSIYFVEDGVELMDYLRTQNQFSDPADAPSPDLILLDLNMPRKDGREALAEIKSDPLLRYIPVVVLTTSKAEEDIMRSYDIGAASYITKPVTFDGLVEAIRGLGQYWVQIVRLPVKEKA